MSRCDSAFLRLACLCLLAMLGSGCVLWPRPVVEDANMVAWNARQAVLRELDEWTLQGRVASGGVLGFTGRLRWRQSMEQCVVDISGPLGAGATRVTGTSSRIEIRDAEGAWVTDDPEAALREAYGWTLPLTGLRQWAVGLPMADVPADLQVDASGRLVTLTQAGWTVTYEAYADTGAGVALPQKIIIDNGETRWRLLVDRWTVTALA